MTEIKRKPSAWFRKTFAAGSRMKPIIAIVTAGIASMPLNWVWANEMPQNKPEHAIKAVPFKSIELNSTFWRPRQEVNRTVTVVHNLEQLERQGSLGGFRILAGLSNEEYHGYIWGDSDVYKTIEGIAYTLQTHPDAELEKRMDLIVESIVKAQAPDGYLMPHIQIREPQYVYFKDEMNRTSELYDMGHMIESAVAHCQSTGKRNYLEAAIKLADFIVSHFKTLKQDPSGCPEVELALVKLYQVTGNENYLQMAKLFVERTRQIETRWSNGKPAFAHDEVIGHAVAMFYLYAAAADLAAMTDDEKLMEQLKRKWENLVSYKMYLSGNVGDKRFHEGFPPQNYELPNSGTIYCETCAAIGLIFWNQRMFLATGEAKYLDVLERSLYNGFLAGLGLNGKSFYYSNTLEWDGVNKFNRRNSNSGRFAWTDCPCCPTNIVRLMPVVAEYAYALKDKTIYVNQFMGGRVKLDVGGIPVKLEQQTDYPWNGTVKLVLAPENATEFELKIRIPGWARNLPVPSSLYQYIDKNGQPASLKLNGQPSEFREENGFACLFRQWKAGDSIELTLPMPVRTVAAAPELKYNTGRVAFERGPIVYCAEGVDNNGKVLSTTIDKESAYLPESKPELLGGVTILKPAKPATAPVLIPYYAWSNRGPTEMMVWMPYHTGGK